MKRVSRAHEDVITAIRCVQTERGGHLSEIADYVVGLFFGSAIVSLRRALDIDAVFVCASEKEGLNSLLPLRPRDRVGDNHRIEVTEMRQAVGVIDWSRDVESFHRALSDRLEADQF